MNHTIAFQGIRGGVGTTSVIAMLGDALNQQGASVLMVDLTPDNTLRLMFNVAYAEPRGWAHALQAGTDWRAAAFEVSQGLCLLPHGDAPALCQHLDAFSAELVEQLQPDFDWILLDLPPGPSLTQFSRLQPDLTMAVTVLSPDVGCHLRWIERPRSPRNRFLVTQFDPTRKLSADLVSEWQYQAGDSLLPVSISADESVHEAFASKSTATRMFPDSAATANVHSLTTWLQARRFGEPSR